MENYFNYFTDIEEHFCRRRGSLLTVSPLDWALMETWKEAGIPLEAVLRGIDVTFDRFERRPAKSKTKRINGLAWCTQEVLFAAEEMNQAAAGSRSRQCNSVPGLGPADVAAFLTRNANALDKITKDALIGPLQSAVAEAATSLREMVEIENMKAAVPKPAQSGSQLEELERQLTVLEEKMLAALTVTAPEAELIRLRAEADREMAPYRSKMPGFQIEQLRQQFVYKRLFEQAKIPRLSLFYM